MEVRPPPVRLLSRRAVFVTALVVSLAAHVAAVWGSWGVPLLRFDLIPAEERQTPYRVLRSERDVVVDEVQDGNPVETPTQALSLAQMSQALLDAPAPTQRSTATEPAPLRVRDLPGDQPEQPPLPAPLAPPPVELPRELLAAVAERARPSALEFVPAPTAGGAAGLGGQGSAAAAQALAGAGLAPIQPSSRPPRVAEPAAVDQRRLAAPVDTSGIDFIDLALAGTTQMVMPEHLDSDFDYQLTRYVERSGQAYFRLDITARRSLRKLATMPKDVVFLVDISSSIPQDYVNQVVAGLSDALGSLNDGDRFNIVLFREQALFLATDEPLPATPQNIDKARAFLGEARSTGYTDVNRALSRLLVRDDGGPRVYNLVLISDGRPTKGIQDTRQLINLVTRENDLNASIYTIAVTRQPNVELLDFLAYRNKGFSVTAERLDQVAPTIRDLMSRLRFPIVKDVALSVVGLRGGEVYPLQLPNIHQGERFSVFGRYEPDASGRDDFMVRFTGRSAGQPVDFTFARDLSEVPQGEQDLRQGWALLKLHHLYSEMIRQGETKDLLDQIAELRKRYKVKTLY